MNTKTKLIFYILLISLLILPSSARADIAPPETPPGANLEPGEENTQVRMVSETVTLSVKEKAPAGSLGQAAVSAVFQMQNQGGTEERMEVRFPLTFYTGLPSGGPEEYPEIKDIKVKVDGQNVPARRVTTENPSRAFNTPIPWAAFEASFPPGEIVEIEVTYTQEGYGEYPFVIYRYILETGAGWNGTIGSADLIVRLPYEANRQNTIFDVTVGFGLTDPGAVLDGNEIRWHYVDFEPVQDHNLDVTLVMPEAWKKILIERENTAKNPKDGEAWGRLGKALKEAIRVRRGVREDEGGVQLYQESVAAYEKSLALLPEDALWHYGYADLLWIHYYYHVYSFLKEAHDQTELVNALDALRQSLELDPHNERALDLLQEIAWSIPEAVQMEDGEYTLLALTATPDYPTPYPTIVIQEETPTSETTATARPAPTQTPVPTQVESPTEVVIPQELTQPPSDPEFTPVASALQPQETQRKTLPCFGSLLMPLMIIALPALRRSRRRT